MTPSGLRISCANPAESWPRAASRSERRASACGLLEAAIGFRQAFREFAVQLGLMPALLREAVHHHGREKEKQDAAARAGRMPRRVNSYSCSAG